MGWSDPLTVSVRGRGTWGMMSVPQLDKSSPYWRLITNFVLKTTNLSHLYIQNMNKKFIMDDSPIICPLSSPSACLGCQIIFLRLAAFSGCHRDNGRVQGSIYHLVDTAAVQLNNILLFGEQNYHQNLINSFHWRPQFCTLKGNLNSNLTIELLLYFLSCCGKIRQNRRDKLYPERLFSSIEYFEIEKSATV